MNNYRNTINISFISNGFELVVWIANDKEDNVCVLKWLRIDTTG